MERKLNVKPKTRHTGFVTAEEIFPEMVSKGQQSQFKNDGRYVLLSDLPTKYRYYNFTELWIRPFTPNEARLIHMAKLSGNLTYLISAVSSCISVPINQLILEDFDFCIYWLRINSYPNRPFNVTWSCVAEIEGKDKKSKKIICEKENFSTISKANLTVVSLDNDFKLDSNLSFPRMNIFEELWTIHNRLELMEKENVEGEEKDELLGDVYLMAIAQWLKEGDTLADKLNILKSQPSMDFQLKIEDAVNLVPTFGVSEDIELICVNCGGSTRRRLSLDYLSFFP